MSQFAVQTETIVPCAAPVRVGAGFVFIGPVNGVGAEDAGSMHQQAVVALARIEKLLGAHGLDLSHVTQVRYLARHGRGDEEFGRCATLFQALLRDPRPHLTQVPAALFPNGAVIQIEVRARLG